MSLDADRKIKQLPRGGQLIQTKSGPFQFGVPPETIKDTMATEVPATFILPGAMFSMDAGISMGELEFPIYYHFFFKQKKIRVICTPSQQRRLEIMLREALFGPDHLDYEREFVNGSHTPGFPDLRAEMIRFRTMPINGETRLLELEDVVEFLTMSPENPVQLGGVTVRIQKNDTITIEEDGRQIARFDPGLSLAPEVKPFEVSSEVFYPPLFGVTTLGAGHGFAPNAMTSGMIIWVNRRGILVDPPVNSTPELARLGVPPKILDSVILTHCHADHDAGTLQKILQEGTITLYTTPTIFNSFLKKSAALTGISGELLEKAVRFKPMVIDVPVNINGGLFRFNYCLHSIPTISIQADFGGKTLIYSSDTHNDSEFVNRIFEEGVVSQDRREHLNDFPWDRDLIFHEAGIPPLHTPMSTLAGLPKSVRNRLYLVHVTQDLIPKGSDLKIAPTGLCATVELQVAPSDYCRSIEILGTYLDQPLFRDLPPEKAMEFLCMAQTKHFKPKEPILRQGEPGEHMFFIMTGQAEIIKDGDRVTTLGRSDFFGEKCLFNESGRTASVTAVSDVRLIAVHRDDMQAFIRTTHVEASLPHLATVQNRVLRKLLNLNPFFRPLTPSQKTGLFQILTLAEPREKDHGSAITRTDLTRACHLIARGEVRIYRERSPVTRMGPGGLLGAWALFNEKKPPPFTYEARPGTVLYTMDCTKLAAFAQNNPGLYLKLYAYDY